MIEVAMLKRFDVYVYKGHGTNDPKLGGDALSASGNSTTGRPGGYYTEPTLGGKQPVTPIPSKDVADESKKPVSGHDAYPGSGAKMVVVAACLIGDETGRSFVSVGAKVVGVIGGKGGYGVTSSAVETFVSGVMTKGMTFAAARDEANKIISKSNSYGGQTGRLKLYFSNGVSESSKFSDLNK